MHGPPISVGGDVNVCIAHPKNEQEAEIVATRISLFTLWGVDHLPQMAPTHCGRHGNRALDVMAAPQEAAYKWSTRLGWMQH
eukprot:6938643-Lingulodinium_polyedra.AAC.1